jgi:hypothetical protein
MRAGRSIRPVFKTIYKSVEGADRRGLAGGKASDLRQAWMRAQVVRPLGETFIMEEQHEEEGPQDTDWVVGRPPTGARGVECLQEGTGWVEIEAQEHEGGFVPGFRQAARLAAQPALELGGQGGAILGMR